MCVAGYSQYAEPVQCHHRYGTAFTECFGALRSLTEQNKALTLRNAHLEDEVASDSHNQHLHETDQAMADVQADNARLQVTLAGSSSTCQSTSYFGNMQRMHVTALEGRLVEIFGQLRSSFSAMREHLPFVWTRIFLRCAGQDYEAKQQCISSSICARAAGAAQEGECHAPC